MDAKCMATHQNLPPKSPWNLQSPLSEASWDEVLHLCHSLDHQFNIKWYINMFSGFIMFRRKPYLVRRFSWKYPWDSAQLPTEPSWSCRTMATIGAVLASHDTCTSVVMMGTCLAMWQCSMLPAEHVSFCCSFEFFVSLCKSRCGIAIIHLHITILNYIE